MSLFLTLHENQAAYDAVKDNLPKPQVALIEDSMAVDYQPYVPPISVTGVSLNKNTLELNTEATETLVATVVPNDADNKSVTWSSSNSNIATVDSNGVVSGVASGSCIITVTTTDGGFTAQCSTTISDPSGGHAYVDLGLPSGTKWATMNVGASSETEYGLYFQWGDTQGYTAAQVGSGEGQKYFGWADYKYGNGTSSPTATGMTKYNSTDGKTVLDASDDAVIANWGGSWKMPTETQFNELLNNSYCTNVWTGITVGGTTVYGILFTSKFNGNTLFFPVAGYCGNGSVNSANSFGHYWSSSLNISDVTYGRRLYFQSASTGTANALRCYGNQVRPVMDA